MNSPYRFNPDDVRRFANEQGIRGKTKGDEYLLERCPYCHGGSNNDRWTFAINLTSGVFNCKRGSCGRTGNMITLHKDFGFSLGEGIDSYFDQTTRFRSFLHREKIVPKSRAVEYLVSRGISQAVVEEYEITTRKDDDSVLVFPFLDERNEMWFIKYRNLDYQKGEKGSKEWCEPNRKPILFGMNHCNFKNKTLVMTEGQIDSLSCTEAGIENAVSVPTGKNGFTWTPYCWNFLGRFDTLIIFGDYENGQITLLEDMKNRFNGKIKHVREEDYRDCKDANDLLQKYGKEAVRDAVQNAVPVPVPRLKNAKNVQRVHADQMERIRTGFNKLDDILGGLYFGQTIVVTGERGLGKSTWTEQLAAQALDDSHHMSVFVYSGELNDWQVKNTIDKQLAGHHNISPINDRFGFPIGYDVNEEANTKIEDWYDGRLWIYSNDIDMTEDELEQSDNGKSDEDEIIEALVESIDQYGVRFAIIDNLMTAIEVDGDMDLNRAQTAFVKRLSKISKKYNIIILLVVHPRKSNGANFTNDDVAGSSNITNLADAVIKYGRAKKVTVVTLRSGEQKEKIEDDPDSPDRELIVYKNRNTGRTNATKGIRVYYQNDSKRVSEVANQFDWQYGWEQPVAADSDQSEDEVPDEIPF